MKIRQEFIKGDMDCINVLNKPISVLISELKDILARHGNVFLGRNSPGIVDGLYSLYKEVEITKEEEISELEDLIFFCKERIKSHEESIVDWEKELQKLKEKSEWV